MLNLFHTLEQQLKSIINLENPTKKPLILVGLSGGPDSVFLLYFMAHLQKLGLININAAHLDHGWRENSNNDTIFCKKLCVTLNIPLFLGHAKTFENDFPKNGSQEERGRKIRRAFFEQLTKEHTIDYIALAHHAQDQEETFFLRLIRGSSLTGLCGIKPLTGKYLHPLLLITKEEILTFLQTNSIPFCTDPTNQSLDFLRNKIRHQLIPVLNNIDPRFSKKLQDTMHNLMAEELFLQNITKTTYSTLFKTENGFIKGNLQYFNNLRGEHESTIQNRLLLLFLEKNNVPFNPSNAFLKEFIRFLKMPEGGEHQLHQSWSCIKKNGFFWILKK